MAFTLLNNFYFKYEVSNRLHMLNVFFPQCLSLIFKPGFQVRKSRFIFGLGQYHVHNPSER
jgi:hypothetical protein